MMQPFRGTARQWNDCIAGLPDPHLLQSWEWSRVKARYGWEPVPYVWLEEPCEGSGLSLGAQNNPLQGCKTLAAAMLLKRRIPIRGLSARLNVLYLPKGPLLDWSDEPLRKRVLDDLQTFAKQQGAIFLKMDPDVVLGRGVPEDNLPLTDRGKEKSPHAAKAGQAVLSDLKRRGWLFSSDQIQFRNTVLLDLSATEAELLARMKQKTRYNIRLAGRKGVSVRVGTDEDLPLLYSMYAETSVRDGFVIRDQNYYRTVWHTFMESKTPACEPLIAEVNGEPVAAIFVFFFAGRAYYLYGMSRETHREKMPNYLLQWEAIKRAKLAGCSVYDLWGAPDVFDQSDPMWGVFRFKDGLGGQVVRTLGAWDYTPRPFWYKMYSQVIPRLLDVMRTRGKSRTRQALE